MRLLLALLVASVAASAQAQTPPPGQPGAMVRMRQPSPPAVVGDLADVPMALIEGRPTVTVDIAGRSLRFIVDTGATGQLLLRPEIAEAMGLQPVGRARVGDPSGGFQERRVFQVPSLKLGGLEFRDLMTVEFTPAAGRLTGIDGILGARTYAELLLTLDYAHGRMRLDRGELPAEALGYEISGPGAITLPVNVGAEMFKVHLDSGNGRAPLILPQADGERLAKPGTARALGASGTLISSVQMSQGELASPVRAGGVVLPVKEVAWPSLGPEGNLGSLALKGAVLKLDQKNRRVAIAFPRS